MAAISMDERKGFADRVCHKFDKFWQWKLPCPVDPFEDIYRLAWADDEWIAMNWLRERKPDTFAQHTGFRMYYGDEVKAKVVFKFPEGVKLPAFSVHLADMPDHVQRKVSDWLRSVNRFRLLRRNLRERVSGVMGNPNGFSGQNRFPYVRRFKDLDPKVNTPKQLYRLWPEIQPLMYPTWKRDIQLQAVKAPLPKVVGYDVVRDGRHYWATPEQFRCEDDGALEQERREFEELNLIFTMVSLASDVPHVTDYPEFSGGI